MSAEINEKRGRRRRRTKEEVTADTTDELVEDEVVDEQRGITAGKGRPTVGRRSRTQVEEPTGNVVTRPIGGVREYFLGVASELEKVSWPTREDVVRLTRIVLAVTIVASIVLGIISLAFTYLFRYGLENPVVFVVFFALVGVAAFLINRYYKNSSTDYSSRL